MISRITAFFTLKRVLVLLAVAVLVTLLLLDSSMIKPAILVVLAAGALGVLGIWVRHRFKAIRASEGLKQMISNDATAPDTGDTQALKERLQAAIADIKSSRMGRLRGSAALYELPWYLVIGNPSAGKSTAILNSGLHFPFTDQKGSVLHGMLWRLWEHIRRYMEEDGPPIQPGETLRTSGFGKLPKFPAHLIEAAGGPSLTLEQVEALSRQLAKAADAEKSQADA